MNLVYYFLGTQCSWLTIEFTKLLLNLSLQTCRLDQKLLCFALLVGTCNDKCLQLYARSPVRDLLMQIPYDI